MPSTPPPAPTSTMIHVPPARAATLLSNLSTIQSRLAAALAASPTPARPVRLVCVSKLKPAADILALHRAPAAQLHFGENYQQELTRKAELLPASVRWHFIGALQTNKCRPLAEGVSNLWCVSSVDTAKKADALEKGRAALAARVREEEGGRVLEPLRVQVQVNTSGEVEKSGVAPAEAAALVRHIREKCAHLRVTGLMTIGAIARSRAGGENEDFRCLAETRRMVAGELGMEEGELELGMGDRKSVV